MSREIDTTKPLSDDDKRYLAQRGQLTGHSVEDQRKLLDPELSSVSLHDLANTGDVNLRNVSKEDLEAELELRRQAEEDAGLPILKPDGIRTEEVAPYSAWTKADLILETQARNEKRDEDDQFLIGGNKAELVQQLEDDDAAQDNSQTEG